MDLTCCCCTPTEKCPCCMKISNVDPLEKELTKEGLRECILKQLRERKFFQTLNSKLDKGEYRMRKEQLFRRLQIEREERTFQECMCKAEQDKCKRERNIIQEEQFAEAIKDLKDDETRDSAFRKQLHECAPEIRNLQRELRRAYYAKTLYAQRMEDDAKKLEEKMRQKEMHDMLLEKLEKYDLDELRKEEAEFRKKKDYFKAITNQLEDATSKKAKKEEESEKDKQMVDEIIAMIKQEEIEDLIEKNEKVKLYRSEIKHFLESREYHRERERNRKKLEEEKINEFNSSKEHQKAQYEKAKAERDAVKAGIVAKTIERIMAEQFRIEELEDLRRTLHEEEMAEQVRRQEEEDKIKRYNQMIELQAAEAEAKKLRADKIAAEKKEEEEFRAELIARFAEDDRLEQMGYQKRKAKEREHFKKVQEMVIERRALKAAEREREQEVRHCFDEETRRRHDLIEIERHKLLREHGPKVLGFIPRGVIQSQAELEKLGEPFLSYYRNQPREPHPTTIDSTPCEEEIFKNFEIPKYAKY